MDTFDRRDDIDQDRRMGRAAEGDSALPGVREGAASEEVTDRCAATAPEDAELAGKGGAKRAALRDLDADDDDRDLDDDEGDEGDEGEGDHSEPAELGAAADAPPAVSRKVRRRRRRSRPRSKTIAMKRLTREELRIGAMMYPPVDIPRPSTRMECLSEQRPCPWVACKHHLYLDVNPETGSIKINFPDLEPWELSDTCALDVADRGGITLEEVGEIMNLTRERIRQVEVRGLLKLKMASPSPEELGSGLLLGGEIDPEN
jgi:hypothetical protein